MTQMRKITLSVPADLLANCQEISGTGVSETLRTALKEMQHQWARRRFLELQGTVDVETDGLTLKMLRDMDEDGDRDHRAA